MRSCDCPKCEADISESYQSEDWSVGAGAGWYCDACDLAVGDDGHYEPMEGDVGIMPAPLPAVREIGEYRNMTDLKTELAPRMISRADKDSLPADHPMRTLALAFENAATGFYSEPQTVGPKPFLGAWARARRAWCDYTGESLI